jgi:hypothetical protein
MFFSGDTTEPTTTITTTDGTFVYDPVKMGALTASGNLTVTNATPTLALNNTAPTISTNSSGSTASVFNTNATTVNAFGGSTSTTIGASTGTHTVNNATVTLANATILNLNGASPSIATSSTTASVFNSTVTTLNIGGAASTIAIGVNSGTTTLKGTLAIAGSSSGSVSFVAPATAGTQAYTLPSALPGSNGYALVGTTGGTLSWAAAGAVIATDTTDTVLYPTMTTLTTGNFTAAKVNTSFKLNANTGDLSIGGALYVTQAAGNNQFLSLSVQNSTSGTTAGTAMYWGNDASQFNGIITKWSSAHSTKANYFEMNNVSSAPITFVINSTEQMRLSTAGVLTTVGGFVESSSITLKENVMPIENALETVLQLCGVTYDRRDGSKKNEPGLIAERVAEIADNLVMRDEKGNPTGIYYSKITAYLVEAIKGLHSRLDPMMEEISRLKGK